MREMWTERAKTLSNYSEVISYIEFQDCFHDYILGNIQISNSEIKVFIEEDKKGDAHVWNFSFFHTSDFKMEMDCVLPAYITEIEINNHIVSISLNNGYISFYAKDISLGIPKI